MGKDAWIFFSSGFVAYGLTQYIRQGRLAGLLAAGRQFSGPARLALVPDIDYVKVQDNGDRYFLAQARLGAYYRSEDEYEVVGRYKGRDLADIAYEPLFPYFADTEKQGAFRTYIAEYVTTEDGTGIVHTAPGFGEDDYQLLKATRIPTVCPVDEEGKFTPEVSDYQGLFVKDADRQIARDLKEQGKLVKRETAGLFYDRKRRCLRYCIDQWLSTNRSRATVIQPQSKGE